MESEQLQRAIEAILFAAGERIDIGRLAAALETDASDVEKAADNLADKYAFERRGIRILKLEKGYQMVSSGEMADYVTKALETRKPPKLFLSAGNPDHHRLLPAGDEGHGGADPRRGQRLFRGGAAEQKAHRGGGTSECSGTPDSV